MKNMIKIFRKVQLKNPYFIAAWPGMGNVALKTFYFWKAPSLKICAKKIGASANSYGGNRPVKDFGGKIGKHDLVIFISEAQTSADKGYFYAHKLMEAAESFHCKKVFTFAAMPAPIEHTQTPKVWFTATNKVLSLEMKRFNVRRMDTGQISGLNGLLLAVAKERNQDGVCLLGEIPLYTIQIDNPKASLAILEVLSRVLGISLDLKELKVQAEFQEEEINRLIEYFRGGMELKEPINDEEIERIKKALQSYTKLPNSARERIERMFGVARGDLSKANELKEELDKWSIYKDYEDRFLDLFKDKEKSDK